MATVTIIGIAGGSCSGKTRLLRRLHGALGDAQCAVVLQDDYYRSRPEAQADNLAFNFDHPDAIDFDHLATDLARLKSGADIASPRYDFARHVRLDDTVRQVPARPVILVDGILILASPVARAAIDYGVFIRCDADTRLERRQPSMRTSCSTSRTCTATKRCSRCCAIAGRCPVSAEARGHPLPALAPGAALAAALAALAYALSGSLGGPVMVYALLAGMALHGLSGRPGIKPGIEFAGRRVLRFGVALLGLRITLGEVQALGVASALIAVGSVAVTLVGGYWVARWAGLSRQFAILTAGAVAICGASAALAIAAVLPADEHTDRHAILAVVGVNALSTIAMVGYPLLTGALGFDDVAAGIFFGASIHDVAQVVGAGYTVSPTAGDTATLVKLMRVACLVPAVAAIAWLFHVRDGGADGKPPPLPLFLFAFVVLVGINSAGVLPEAFVAPLRRLSGVLLVVAVAALGVKTSLRGLITVGTGPVIAMTVQSLIVAGYALAALLLLA